MDTITYKGRLDYLFGTDDRDPIVEQKPDEERIPQFSNESLDECKPSRPLTKEEAAIIDSLGMPKKS